jgi:sugar/nucleoside kinase (ribokinase family)
MPIAASSYDVVAVGNALVDVLAQVPDSFLAEHGMEKGTMSLVDAAVALRLQNALNNTVQTSGGSAANTMSGIASLGGAALFIGKVSNDDLGAEFKREIESIGVQFVRGAPVAGIPTGRCVIAVTPDAQRTLNTFLGVSSLLTPEDIDPVAVAAGKVVYLEGYLYDEPAAKAAFREAANIAHGANRKVSLTLSDAFCVQRHRDDFHALIAEEVDILFGNEAELEALYETSDFNEAVAQLRAHCEFAVITRSEKGSVVVTHGEVLEVPAAKVAEVVDTTGAGDLFAAGFLYGFTRDMDLARCAEIGAIAAAEVISHMGPRPLVPLSSLIK